MLFKKILIKGTCEGFQIPISVHTYQGVVKILLLRGVEFFFYKHKEITKLKQHTEVMYKHGQTNPVTCERVKRQHVLKLSTSAHCNLHTTNIFSLICKVFGFWTPRLPSPAPSTYPLDTHTTKYQVNQSKLQKL